MKSNKSTKRTRVIDFGVLYVDESDPDVGFHCSLEIGADGKWTMFKSPEDEPSRREAIPCDPDRCSAFEQVGATFFESDPVQITEYAELVANQDWDSGGPGAGAGSVSVYELGGVYFVTHDAGIGGPYDSKSEAIGCNFAYDEATVSTWGDDD